MPIPGLSMKRRTLKKQIPQLTERLSSPTKKYLAANHRVAQDVLYSYERAIEVVLVDLMRIYLTLDRSWPHRERWLDGLNEEFSWERKLGILYGSGELLWGHWPRTSWAITRLQYRTMLTFCPSHGLEYRLTYEENNEVTTFGSRRWCHARQV